MAESHSLGGRVRALREPRSMSQAQLAEKAEIAEELVRQIEGGALIPSLSPLLRIARSLGVRLGTFLDDEERIGPVVSRGGGHAPVIRFSGREAPVRSDLDFFSLAANKAGRHMEPFLIEIGPGSAEEARASSHDGEELIYVLCGEVEVTCGADLHHLAPGDSLYYDSTVPHHVHSVGGAARVLAVVFAP